MAQQTLLKMGWKELLEKMRAQEIEGKIKLGTVIGQEHVIVTDEESPCILLVNASTIDQVINAREGGVNNMVTLHPGDLFLSDSYRHVDFMFLNEPSNSWAEPYRAYDQIKGRKLREPRATYILNDNIPSEAFMTEKKAAIKQVPDPQSQVHELTAFEGVEDLLLSEIKVPNILLPSTPGAIPLFDDEIRAALGAPSERELTAGDISDAVDRGIIEFSNWQPRTQAVTLLTQPDKIIYDSSDFEPADTMILAILSSSLRAAPMSGGSVGSDPSTPTDAYISLYAAEAANDADEQFLEMNGGQVAVIGNVAPGTTVSAYAYVAWKRANFPMKHFEDLRSISRAYAGQRLLALRSKFTQVNFGVSAFSLNTATLQSLVREWEENFRARVSRVPFAPL